MRSFALLLPAWLLLPVVSAGVDLVDTCYNLDGISDCSGTYEHPVDAVARECEYFVSW